MRPIINSLSHVGRRLLAAGLLSSLLLACTQPTLTSPNDSHNEPVSILNSDGIRERFGNYGVEIIRQDDSTRLSGLFSVDDATGIKTTRTLAVVLFDELARTRLADEHQLIIAGNSIGITFREAGWNIHKQHLLFGEIDLADSALMHKLMPAADLSSVAMHIYDFSVERHGRTHRYATIAEIHHPDYLSLEDLQHRYVIDARTNNHSNIESTELAQRVLREIDR